jgi:hypothetical protein
MRLKFQAATVACHTEMSNISQGLLQQYFANLPFDKEYFHLPTKSVDNFVDDSWG